MVGLAALGAFISVETGGLGTFAYGAWAEDIIAGAAVGAAVGNTINSLFPGRSTYTGPRLLDTQVMGSTPGAPVPWVYGGCRIAGQVIWSTGIEEVETTSSNSAKGGPSATSTTYAYTTSVAVAFCEGVASITRLWGDSKLIYDTTGKGANSSLFNTGILNASGVSSTVTILPRIYTGTATQQPDPQMQAALGINNTPAYRNICYCVFEGLPMYDFGNRLPNIRAELSSGTVQAYLKDIYPVAGITDIYASPQVPSPANFFYTDPVQRAAFTVDAAGGVVQRIDMNTDNTETLAGWVANTQYALGDQILDSAGNVQMVISGSGNFLTGPGPAHPVWGNFEGGQVQDNHVRWTSLGAGPDAIEITSEGLLTPHTTMSSLGVNTPYACGVGMDGFFYSPMGDGSHTYIGKFDPYTFLEVSRFTFNGFPSDQSSEFPMSTGFFNTSGGAYIITTTPSNTSHTTYVVECKNMSVVGSFDWLAALGPTSGLTDGIMQPCISNSGMVYMIQYNTGTFEWAVVAFDTNSKDAPVTFTHTETSLDDVVIAALYNEADDSLFGFTSGGGLKHIDIATQSVTATGANGTIVTGTVITRIPKSYPQGQVPSDGQARCLGTDSVLGATIVTLDSLTCGVNSVLAQSLWLVDAGGNAIVDFAFDEATNSMICTNTYQQVSYRLYLNRQTVPGVALDQVFTDLCTRSGLDSSLTDFTSVSGINVQGYPITRNADARSLLGPLCAAYFVDIVESNNILKAVPRGGPVAFSIPESDLGLSSQGYELKETYPQQNDLPKIVEITYAEPDLDYQQGKQARQRNARVVTTKTKVSIELPLTLDEDVAAQIAEKTLTAIWAEKTNYETSLFKAIYATLDPSDVLQITYQTIPIATRAAKVTTGADYSIELSLVSEDPSAYVSTRTGSPSPGFVPQVLNPLPPSILFLMDVPLLQDTDNDPTGTTGIYYGMASFGRGWPGAQLSDSPDASTYTPIGFASDEIPFGTVSTALPAPASPWTWDMVNTITLRMTTGTSLNSDTELNVLSGTNAALLGGEVIQWVTATQNTDGTTTLSQLLRGRRGTEFACGTHIAGETFLKLQADAGVHRVTFGTAAIGVTEYFKATTIGLTPDSSQPIELATTGADLKPYAVASLQGTRY